MRGRAQLSLRYLQNDSPPPDFFKVITRVIPRRARASSIEFLTARATPLMRHGRRRRETFLLADFFFGEKLKGNNARSSLMRCLSLGKEDRPACNSNLITRGSALRIN